VYTTKNTKHQTKIFELLLHTQEDWAQRGAGPADPPGRGSLLLYKVTQHLYTTKDYSASNKNCYRKIWHPPLSDFASASVHNKKYKASNKNI
jgi:hypothetical protein